MDIAAFNWADYTILGIAVFSTLISFARGFVREAISLATWVAGVWVAYKYGHEFGERFITMVEAGQLRSLIGSAILFFSVLLTGAFINYSINQFVHVSGLSAIDRILGMAFGLVRGILLIAVLILVGQITEADKKPWWAESQVIPQFAGITEWLKSFVPEQFEKLKNPAQPGTPALAPPIPQPADAAPTNPNVTIKLDSIESPSITINAPASKQEPAAAAPAAKSPASTAPATNPAYY